MKTKDPGYCEECGEPAHACCCGECPPDGSPDEGYTFRNGDIGECTVTEVWKSRFGDWKVSYADKRGGGGLMNLEYFTERFGTVTTEHHFTVEERWHPDEPPNNRPQDGKVCDCEDAPCCGHYEL